MLVKIIKKWKKESYQERWKEMKEDREFNTNNDNKDGTRDQKKNDLL